jgi:hypothetical protein
MVVPATGVLRLQTRTGARRRQRCSALTSPTATSCQESGSGNATEHRTRKRIHSISSETSSPLKLTGASDLEAPAGNRRFPSSLLRSTQYFNILSQLQIKCERKIYLRLAALPRKADGLPWVEGAHVAPKAKSVGTPNSCMPLEGGLPKQARSTGCANAPRHSGSQPTPQPAKGGNAKPRSGLYSAREPP